MLPFMKGDFGNPSSIHSLARKPRVAVREARATIAECIGAEPEEIFFTSGGTEADNWAVKGSEGGLLVSAYEHHAVLKAVAHEAGRGRMVVYARPTRKGDLMKLQFKNQSQNLSCFRQWEFRSFGGLERIFETSQRLQDSETPSSESNDCEIMEL